MTKVQVASVISRLPVIPFLGKKEKVKVETKPEMGTTEPRTEAPQVPEMPRVLKAPRVPEMPRVLKAPPVPEMP